MFEKLTERFHQVRDSFGEIQPARKVLILAVIAAVLAGFIYVMILINETPYAVLYSGLSQEDAGAMVAKLNEAKTPYRLEQNGTTILVPAEKVQELRLTLATEGLPTGGATGMELFDKTALGATDFLQRLNYQRALQGELERTIRKFPEVGLVRVHLNIPKQSLFIEEAREPSASVVVKLKAGRTLSRAQLAGIVHLVSSSVEGLKPDNVSIVDTDGGLLYAKEEGPGISLNEAQLQHRRAIEKTLAEKVEALLERMVGPDKAMARVTAELDLQQISTSEEVYDPDRSVIRSEQRLSETNQGAARGAAGTPTATYELGTGQRAGAATGAGTEVYAKTEEATNYEITKISRQILTAAGEVKRLSVAVLVAGTYEEKTEGGQPVRTLVSPTEAELAEMEKVVKGAVGYNEARGDSVVVTPAAFHLPEEAAAAWWLALLDFLRSLGRPLLSILAIVLFFLFGVRPLMRWLYKLSQPEAPEVPLPSLPEGVAAEALPTPEPGRYEKGKLTREQVMHLAQQNPERTINLIRSWIDER
ncbi:MAG: flagellar basal-body MS-ring/collar protein FliF [Thermodesulfobacteriota bacterium]